MTEIATTSRRSKARHPRRTAAGPRAGRRAERRRAILAAALKEFSARGFAAARLGDVADAAGIAKGTIYLYFRDKEALFQDLILSEMPVPWWRRSKPRSPSTCRCARWRSGRSAVRARDLRHQPPGDHPPHPPAKGRAFRSWPISTIGRCCCRARIVAQRSCAPSDAIIRFPQLLGAPGIVVAILWSGLFQRRRDHRRGEA